MAQSFQITYTSCSVLEFSYRNCKKELKVLHCKDLEGGEGTTLSSQWQLTYAKTLCVGTDAYRSLACFLLLYTWPPLHIDIFKHLIA